MKKAQEEAAKNATPFGRGGFSFRSDSEGTQVEVGPNGAKVTVTEPGPDGKPVTKTYEGKDLDTIKKEHPEIANRIGHFSVRLGPVPPGARSAPDADDDDGDDAKAPTAPAWPDASTGPFGLGLLGARVQAVRPGSDAAAAGLRPGDVITAVNGKAVDSTTSVADLVKAGRESGSMTFDVTRDGVPTKLTWQRK
jgi:membrane-associated protease RseP (regulator of RpoE activity)